MTAQDQESAADKTDARSGKKHRAIRPGDYGKTGEPSAPSPSAPSKNGMAQHEAAPNPAAKPAAANSVAPAPVRGLT